MRIAIAEAKSTFAEIVRRAEAGEEIELTRHGRPVARIVPATPTARRPLIGALQGRIRIAPDFDAPLPGFAEAFTRDTDPA
jgi:prevent-host-death family protein